MNIRIYADFDDIVGFDDRFGFVRPNPIGLAKSFDETGLSGGTRTGDVGGTWGFMCRPQVINFQRAKAEVDVWALAASLYFMLTGQFPRHFPEGMDRCLAVLENDAVPILKRRSELPKKSANVIDAALRETPTIGFQTASAMRSKMLCDGGRTSPTSVLFGRLQRPMSLR